MLSLLLMSFMQSSNAEMWVPQCNTMLSVGGPLGYASCVEDVLIRKYERLDELEASYLSLLDAANLSEQREAFAEDREHWQEYGDRHCSFLSSAVSGDRQYRINQFNSCRYFLVDRRLAEIEAMANAVRLGFIGRDEAE